MSRNVVIASILVLALILVGWLLMRPKKPVVEVIPTPVSTVIESAAPSAPEGAVMKEAVVVKITSSGFVSKTITVGVGDSISWENTDTAAHIVSSDNHPTHLLYTPLNLGVIKPGETKSLIPSKAGTFTYHDHLNPSLIGSITVE